MEGDRCDFCGEGHLESRQVLEYYRYRDALVVIDQVPTYVCTICGAHYHVAAVAKRLRQIAQCKDSIQETQSFPYTVFDKAALIEPSL